MVCVGRTAASPLSLSRPAADGAVQKLSRRVKMAGVARGLLDHMEGYPTKVGDGLVWPVETMLAEQGRVKVAGSQDLVRDLALSAVLLDHCGTGVSGGERRVGIVGRVLNPVVPCHLRLDPEHDPLEPHGF